MAMEPELRLKFATYTHFCVWKAGLHLMTQLLELPSNPLQVPPAAPWDRPKEAIEQNASP